MKRSVRFLVAALLAAVPASTYAHFKLVEPASWIIETDRGDPQKAGPCGGSNTDWGKPSGMISKAVGGSKLHIKVLETIYHPGHYRVALAVNSQTELPLDPVTTTREGARGPQSVTAVIQDPPRMPVLADGLWVHTAKVTEPFETDVTLPNISCPRCILQVVQWMAEHGFNNPGGYSYHHCADLQIVADTKKPMTPGWPSAARVASR